MFAAFDAFPMAVVVVLFIASAAAIAYFGARLTRLADVIADRTGFGEALTGAVLLGASTSLPGTVTSVWAAATGYVDLALSNAIGGIAAQSAFLVLADVLYRRVNLEHAAASLTNITQTVVLIVMLSLPLVALTSPEIAVFGVHPISAVLFAVYGAGLRIASAVSGAATWRPVETSDTRVDEPDPDVMKHRSTASVCAGFALLVLVLSFAGWLVARTGIEISDRAGISQSVVGALMTAVATSLPELVTTIAAVRRGALQLAVGGIIGGNTYDVLFLAFSDIAYRPGSAYHAMEVDVVFWISVALLMSGVLLLGLLRRERQGVANIGFESVLLLAIYLGAVILQIARA